MILIIIFKWLCTIFLIGDTRNYINFTISLQIDLPPATLIYKHFIIKIFVVLEFFFLPRI